MNKSEFQAAVAEAIGEGMTKKRAGEIVDAVFATLADTIKKNERFSYAGFGTFKVTHRAARTGRNPQTGQSIQIAASKGVSFKPASSLKDSL